MEIIHIVSSHSMTTMFIVVRVKCLLILLRFPHLSNSMSYSLSVLNFSL